MGGPAAFGRTAGDTTGSAGQTRRPGRSV